MERANRTLQDRLVKELRLAGVSNMEAGNVFLPGFLQRYNERFSVRAAKLDDLHRRLHIVPDKLNDILCHREQRYIDAQLTFHYDRKQIILEQTELSKELAGKYVELYDFADRPLEVPWNGHALPYRVFSKDQRVSHAAIIENKRLGHALTLVKAQQDLKRTPKVMTNSEKDGYKKRPRRIYEPDFDSKTSEPAAVEMMEIAKSRVHSRYQPKLDDLPWEGLRVVILLKRGRFFCTDEGCRRKIFTERLPGAVARYARRSCRSGEALNWLTLAFRGPCRSTAGMPSRVAGWQIDVVAWTPSASSHRGCTGAARAWDRWMGVDEGPSLRQDLCDLETHEVIDLLPDRQVKTVARWLREHPGAEIVSRDRGGIYAEATRKAAPGVVQVADRWHLLRNLSEALTDALAPIVAYLRRQQEAAAWTIPRLFRRPCLLGASARSLRREPTGNDELSAGEQVRKLLRTGASNADIGRQLNLDHRTARKFRIDQARARSDVPQEVSQLH